MFQKSCHVPISWSHLTTERRARSGYFAKTNRKLSRGQRSNSLPRFNDRSPHQHLPLCRVLKKASFIREEPTFCFAPLTLTPASLSSSPFFPSFRSSPTRFRARVFRKTAIKFASTSFQVVTLNAVESCFAITVYVNWRRS